MAEFKSFFEYFSKYPQDDTLRDILQFAKVKKILANKDERKLKAFLIFESYVPMATVRLLEKNIKSVYGLSEVTVIDCYDSLASAEYMLNTMEQLMAEIPVLSGYCDGEFDFDGTAFSVAVKFGGSDMLNKMKCNEKIGQFLNTKFNCDFRVGFHDKQMQKMSYDEFKEKISVYEEKPEYRPVERTKESIKPNKVLMGKKIEKESMDISDIRANSGMVCVTGSVYGVRRVTLNENAQLMLFSIEDKTGAVDVKFFITEKTAEAADSLKDDDYITLQAKAEEDVRSGGIVLRARSIAGAIKEERKDNSQLKRSELHIHSTMSPADGLATPEEIIDRASSWGLKAVAITDHGVIQAFPMALKAAKDKDIKVICGSEIYLVADTESAVYGTANIGFRDRFVVFDIETTGLSAAADRITEIGAVIVENGERKEVFSSFVNPKMKIPERIVELTGITDAMVADAPDEEEVLKQFFDFVKDGVLVAHNANFDCGFMRAAAKRCGMAFDYTYIDTVPICRSVFPELKSVKLNVVAEHIGAPKFNHHRAYDDANELAEIFIYLANRLQNSDGVASTGLINASLKGESVSVQRSSHAVVLAKNREGLKNLYKIISLSHDKYYQKYPLVPKSLLNEYREGLLVGSSCCDGELFKMLLDERSEEDVTAACRFYDYFEIQPLSNNMNMVDNGYMKESDQLRKMYTRLMQYGKAQNKPVIATGDAHFLDEEQEIVRDIALSVRGNRFDHSKGPIFFKTTEEMLADFEWVDEETALDLVINNPNMLADMCEDMSALPEGFTVCSDVEDLRSLIDIDSITDLARKDRLISELKTLTENGTDKVLLFALQIKNIANSDGYPCSFGGDITTYHTAYLLGLIDLDPYELDIDFVKNCFDNISVCFLPEYRGKFLENINKIFGENHYFYASQIEYLQHDSVRGYIRRYEENMHSVVRENVARRTYQLMERSKRQLKLNYNSVFIVPKNMDCFDFSPVHKVFDEDGTGKTASHYDIEAFSGGLLRVDFSNDTDSVILRLLEYALGINAKDIPLDDSSVYELFSAYKDDPIIPDGIEGISAAGKIREKGGLVSSLDELTACVGSLKDALTAYRLLWFKKHYMPQFFAAVLSSHAVNVDKQAFFETRENCMRAFSKPEINDTLAVNRIMYEMHENKIDFGGFSLYDSQACRFILSGDKIIMPLFIIDGMNDECADRIVRERGIEKFQSVADMVARCGVDKKCVEAMRSHGLFDNLDENAQISMFSLLQ